MTDTSNGGGAALEPTITIAEAQESLRRAHDNARAGVAHTAEQLEAAQRGIEAAQRKEDRANEDLEAAQLAKEHAQAELAQKEAEHAEALDALAALEGTPE